MIALHQNVANCQNTLTVLTLRWRTAGTTQDYFILPAPPVGGLPISQDWLDRMKLVCNRTDRKNSCDVNSWQVSSWVRICSSFEHTIASPSQRSWVHAIQHTQVEANLHSLGQGGGGHVLCSSPGWQSSNLHSLGQGGGVMSCARHLGGSPPISTPSGRGVSCPVLVTWVAVLQSPLPRTGGVSCPVLVTWVAVLQSPLPRDGRGHVLSGSPSISTPSGRGVMSCPRHPGGSPPTIYLMINYGSSHNLALNKLSTQACGEITSFSFLFFLCLFLLVVHFLFFTHSFIDYVYIVYAKVDFNTHTHRERERERERKREREREREREKCTYRNEYVCVCGGGGACLF